MIYRIITYIKIVIGFSTRKNAQGIYIAMKKNKYITRRKFRRYIV